MKNPKYSVVISRTPYRLNLAGATDLIPYVKRFRGQALSGTIDKYVTIVIRKRPDKKIIFHYALGTEEAVRLEDIAHPYVNAVLKWSGIKSGIDIASFTDIPLASGLGSSGAFTVGLINAIKKFLGFQVSPRELAERAAHLEIKILENPIGKHDQYLAAFGGICDLLFLRNGRVVIKKLRPSPAKQKELENHLLLVYSGMNHSASKALSSVSKRLQTLHPETIQGLHAFRDVGARMKFALAQENFFEFGNLVNDLWEIEKKVFDNSNERIDDLIAKGKILGALSGTIVGAGRGGFIYFFCPDLKTKKKIALGLNKMGAPEYPFHFTHEGSKIIFAT